MEEHGIQQGYLQLINSNFNQRVFVIINNNKLVCYSDDPSKSPAARLPAISSFDLNTSKVIDGGPNLKRPKSFAFSASNSDNSIIGEFVCPTNSIKCQWIKSILDNSKVSVGNQRYLTNEIKGISPVLRPPAQPPHNLLSLNRSITPSRPNVGDGNNNGYILPLNIQTLSYHNSNTPPIANGISMPTHQPNNSQSAPLASSLLISSQRGGITPDGQLKITRKAVGHTFQSSGQVSAPKPLPGWVPNTFGNNRVSSRKVSPQRGVVSGSSKGMAAETSQKGPPNGVRHNGRSLSPNVVDIHGHASQFHDPPQQQMYDHEYHSEQLQHHSNQQQNASQSRSKSSNSSGGGGGGSRIDSLTVSELREALQAIPSHLRSSLVGPYDDENQNNYQQQHSSSSRHNDRDSRGRGARDRRLDVSPPPSRSKSAGAVYSSPYRQQHRSDRERSVSPEQRSQRGGANRQRNEDKAVRSKSTQPDNRYSDRDERDESRNGRSDERSGRESGGSRHSRHANRESGGRRTDHNHRSQHRDESDSRHQQQSETEGEDQDSEDTYAQDQQDDRHYDDHSRNKPRITIDVQYRESDYEQDEEFNRGNSRSADRSPDKQNGVAEDDDRSYESDTDFFENSPGPSPERRKVSHRNDKDVKRDSLKREEDSRSAYRAREKQGAPSQRKAPTPLTSHQSLKTSARSQSVSSTRPRGAAGDSQRADSNYQQSEKGRSVSAHQDRDSRERRERHEEAPAADRKSALEWSRRNATEKKNRVDFPSSPLHHRPTSNTGLGNSGSGAVHSSSGAGQASTPLKFKYKSFNASLEKDDHKLGGEKAIRQQQSAQSSQQQHIGLVVAAKNSKPSGAKNGGGGFLDFMGSRNKHLASHNGTSEEAVGPSAPLQQPVVVMMDPLLAKYRNNKPQQPDTFVPLALRSHGGKPLVRGAPHHSSQQVQQQSRPFFSRPASTLPVETATQSVLNNNVQLNAPQHFDDLSSIEQEISRIRSSSNASDAHSLQNGGGGNENMTDLAEWRRLTDWLKRNALDKYVKKFRAGGVTKLSIVELLTRDDMLAVGVEEADVELLTRRVGDFTKRTRTFSEQVLLSDVEAFNSSREVVRRTSVPTAHAPVAQSRSGPVFAQRQPLAVNVNSNVPAPISVPQTVQLKVTPRTLIQAYQGKSDVRRELVVHFDAGAFEPFFQLWKAATLVHFPPEYSQLNPARPAQYNTKLMMEFHLYLYFSVYAIMNQLGKDEVRRAKDCLKAYLEDMIVTSDFEHLNSPTAHSSPAAQQAMSPGYLLDPTSGMGMHSPQRVSTSTFTRSREFAIYAGLVMVPEPQSNEAFTQIFKHDWMHAMRTRFLLFLDVVGLVVGGTQSDAADISSAELVDVDALREQSTLLSTPRQPYPVQKALFLPTKAGSPLIESHKTSPVVIIHESAEKNDILQESAPNERNDRGLPQNHVQENGTKADSKPASVNSSTKCQSIPPPPVSPTLLVPISPPDSSLLESHIHHHHNAHSQPQHMPSQSEQITSPMSTSSSISQLTDDDNNYDSHHALSSSAGRVPLTIGSVGVHVSPRKSLLNPAAASPGGTSALSSSGGRIVKPFVPLSKSAMQVQVNEYNKLLKQGGAAKSAPAANLNAPNITAVEQTGGVPAPTINDANDVSAATRPTSLVLGSNVRPRQLTTAANLGKILLQPSQTNAKTDGMQAQVNVYNKLLVKSVKSPVPSVDLATVGANAPDVGPDVTVDAAQSADKIPIIAKVVEVETEFADVTVDDVAVAQVADEQDVVKPTVIVESVVETPKVETVSESDPPASVHQAAPVVVGNAVSASEDYVPIESSAGDVPTVELPETRVSSLNLTRCGVITSQSVALAASSVKETSTLSEVTAIDSPSEELSAVVPDEGRNNSEKTVSEDCLPAEDPVSEVAINASLDNVADAELMSSLSEVIETIVNQPVVDDDQAASFTTLNHKPASGSKGKKNKSKK